MFSAKRKCKKNSHDESKWTLQVQTQWASWIPVLGGETVKEVWFISFLLPIFTASRDSSDITCLLVSQNYLTSYYWKKEFHLPFIFPYYITYRNADNQACIQNAYSKSENTVK